MQSLRPCARCEQELPESFFKTSDEMFCKRCSQEINEILRKKYSVIEAAHFRAQLRYTTRKLQQKIQGQRTASSRPASAAAGD